MSADRSTDFVVVGSGPGAAVTAATLRRHGKAVIRVGSAFTHPERPLGAGWCAEAPPTGFEVAAAPRRALLVRGSLLALPLSGADRVRLLPARALPKAGVALGRARVASAIAAFVGGGREERSYRDWVQHRFGAPIYEAVYAPYARARFGDPETLLCGIARVVHGEPPAAGSRAPAGLHDAHPDDIDSVVTGLGEGRVETEAGTIEGRIVVDLAPDEVVRLHGDARLALDAAGLHARHGLEVWVRGTLPEGVDEIHVAGNSTGGPPFFRAVQHAARPGEVALHLAVEPGSPPWTSEAPRLAQELVDAAAGLGLKGLDPAGAVVRWLPRHHAVWTTGHLTRLRTWTEALVDGGIEPVGRVGLVAPMSSAAIAAYAEDRLIHGASLRDCIRHHVEPAPRDSVARPRLADFVTR